MLRRLRRISPGDEDGTHIARQNPPDSKCKPLRLHWRLGTVVLLALLFSIFFFSVNDLNLGRIFGEGRAAPFPPQAERLVKTMDGQQEIQCPDVQSSLQKLDWSKCSIPFDDDDNTIHPVVPAEVDLSNIMLLTTMSNFGQLCNKLGTFAGLIYTLERDNKTSYALAVEETFSQDLLSLDRRLLSRASKNGILLDCKGCDESATFIRCYTLLYKGALFDVSKFALHVRERVFSWDVFWSYRPRNLGYMPWLVNVLQPKAGLKRVIKNSIEKFRETAKKKGTRKIVGIHRRTMDGYCYQWFSQNYSYQCWQHTLAQEQVKYFKLRQENEVLRDYAHYASVVDPLRKNVEEQVPVTITCNYTLEPHQQRTLSETWPLWNEMGPYAFVVADDGRSPKGRESFNRSPAVKYAVDFASLEHPECFARKKNHFMLADMFAMALSDLHMGMVISSCDDIVSIWRRSLGHPSGTSYPTGCYNGFYDDNKPTVKLDLD